MSSRFRLRAVLAPQRSTRFVGATAARESRATAFIWR